MQRQVEISVLVFSQLSNVKCQLLLYAVTKLTPVVHALNDAFLLWGVSTLSEAELTR